jgi:phosphatidylserine decarboxylase
MEYKLKNRNSKEIIAIKESGFTVFLYNTIIGRLILKLLYLPFISKLGGFYMNTPLSKLKIKRFIKKNHLNMDDYEYQKYPNFNAFFTRKIKPSARIINKDDNALISPCDSKLMVYKIDNNIFKIKHSYYQIKDLIKDDINITNGYALIFRLCVDDYHHFCYIDSGTKGENIHIKGIFHTVRPLSNNKYPVYILNDREYTILHTDHFGDVYDIDIGAMMVGKIVNIQSSGKYQKGEEKGYFKFGASTIILLINNIEIDKDILNNSINNIETIVKYGEKIGKKKSS